MRIGELAALVGVSTRTVRHYHHIGVLPEPARHDNGYRIYVMRDAVHLVRIRRLVELGLSLDEIGDALTGDDGRELREILAEIDADLGAQEQRLRARRERIAALLASAGDLTVSPELADVLRGLGGPSPVAEREREVLQLVEHLAGTGQVLAAHRALLDDSALTTAMRDATERFEALADLPVDDPAVDALALAVGGLGGGIRALLPSEILDAPGDPAAAELLRTAVSAGMSPAQARCLQLMFGYWREA